MRRFTIYEAKGSAEWQSGYDAAIEAIREAVKNSGSSQGGDNSPDIPTDPSQQNQGQGQGQQGQGQQGQGQGGSRGGGNQGVVRPEDCIGPQDLANIPGTAGGVMSRSLGDEIAKAEGYEAEGGGDTQVERDWEDRAMSAAKQWSKGGKGQQSMASKLAGIYKSKADWRKELRKVVGRSISEEDKRRGYTNNNVLVSQNRIALTDKQNFNNLDYILVCLDTSGSFFGGTEMQQALKEVATIALQKKPLLIYIVYWDTAIEGVDVYTDANKLVKDLKAGNVKLKGGGGTDPSCIWNMIKTDKRFRNLRPELTMIFTDGYFSPTPKRDPRRMQNLVWCVIDNPGFVAIPDALTKTVHIKLNT